MQPTELLSTEHRVIEQVLACLEKMADEYQQEGKLNRCAARKAIDFFRNFADRCHHGKEEKHLFPLMEARGVPREQGPIGHMLYEHEIGRRYLNEVVAATENAITDDAQAALRFGDAVQGYVAWLRDHIAKEDRVLFPMANRALSAADQTHLLQSFLHTEAHDMGTGAHEKYLQIADQLADRYHVPRVTTESGAPLACTTCCHHHAH